MKTMHATIIEQEALESIERRFTAPVRAPIHDFKIEIETNGIYVDCTEIISVAPSCLIVEPYEKIS